MDYITPFITWLLQSEYIKNNKIFLNAVQAKDNSLQIVTRQIARNSVKKYVNGSKEYPITFNILNYKSVTHDQLVKTMIGSNENLETLLEVNQVITFVEEMENQGNYPDFGENYEVQSVYCEYSTPSSPAIDGNLSLAKYSIPIVCEVLEYDE